MKTPLALLLPYLTDIKMPLIVRHIINLLTVFQGKKKSPLLNEHINHMTHPTFKKMLK